MVKDGQIFISASAPGTTGARVANIGPGRGKTGPLTRES